MTREGHLLDQGGLAAALGIAPPWYLANVYVQDDVRRLHLGLAYPEGSRFPCSRCRACCPAELTWPRTWYHRDFLGYQAYVHTRLPDLGCERCGIVPAEAGWERYGFALLTPEGARLALGGFGLSGPFLCLDDVGHDPRTAVLGIGPPPSAEVMAAES